MGACSRTNTCNAAHLFVINEQMLGLGLYRIFTDASVRGLQFDMPMLPPGAMPTDEDVRTSTTPKSAQDTQRVVDPEKRAVNRKKHIARVMQSFCATPEDFDIQLRKQDGRCAICLERPTEEQSLCVDHNHHPEPGHSRRRGLLCHACNTGIGKLKDDPAVCERAAAYLREWALRNAQ